MKTVVFVLIFGFFLMFVSGRFTSSGTSTDDLASIDDFDPARYMGKWYEIARLPHRFERGLSRVTARYEFRPDGKIAVTNSGWKNGRRKTARGIARPAAGFPRGKGELEVSFFRPFYGKYRILCLEPDYSAALVTSASRDYFWILARTPSLPPDQLEKYRGLAALWGFDVNALEYPQQTP